MKRKFKKIIFCLVIFIIVFNYNVFSMNNIKKVYDNVSQEKMLKMVQEAICVRNSNISAPNMATIFCMPAIKLKCANCYIDFFVASNHMVGLEEAYQLAKDRYSLTTHKGTYQIIIKENSIEIDLEKEKEK